MTTAGFRNRTRSSGIGMGFSAADVGPAGVADGVSARQRAGACDDHTEELTDDLAPVSMAEGVAEHGDVSAHVRAGHRLAEHMGALQVSPFTIDVGAFPGGPSRLSFLSPSFTEVASIRSHVLSFAVSGVMWSIRHLGTSLPLSRTCDGIQVSARNLVRPHPPRRSARVPSWRIQVLPGRVRDVVSGWRSPRGCRAWRPGGRGRRRPTRRRRMPEPR